MGQGIQILLGSAPVRMRAERELYPLPGRRCSKHSFGSVRLLDPMHKNLPLVPQIYLAQATILNAALYPSALQDTDYKDIDRFMARVIEQDNWMHHEMDEQHVPKTRAGWDYHLVNTSTTDVL